MNWAFEHLGLPGDADVRTVKRAYAKALKVNRPADDPMAFQRLREAYEVALGWATRREAAGEESFEPPSVPTFEPIFESLPDAAPVEALAPAGERTRLSETLPAEVDAPSPTVAEQPAPEHAPVQPAPEISPLAMAQAVLNLAATCHSAPEVRDRLAEQPALWQLEFKSEVAHVLPWVLSTEQAPVFADCLDAVWSFFDLDQVTDAAHLDRAYAYQDKRQELSLRWLMVPENRRWVIQPDNLPRLQAAWAPGFMGVRHATKKLGHQLDSASRPRSLWRNVLRAVPWGRMDHMTRLLAWLSHEWQYALVPPLSGEQVRFWLRANDSSRVSLERLAVVFTQYAIALLVVFLPLAGLQFVIDGWSSFDWGFWLFVSAWGSLVPLVRGLWSPLVAWQSLPEEDVTRHAWLHTLCVPALVVAGALMRWLTDQPNYALVIWLWGGWLVFYRFRERQGFGWSLGGSWWRWLLLLFAFKAMVVVYGLLLGAGYWVGAAVLLMWAIELQRARPLALERGATPS